VGRRQGLIDHRKARGLSQERLAQAVGVDTSTVARWERAETDPLAAYRPRLAEALNVPLEELGELLVIRNVRRADRDPVGDATELEPSGSDGHAAYLHAWGALRTLEDLSVFVRTDMMNRRKILAASVTAVTGRALVEPITRWLGTQPVALPASDSSEMGRIGISAVQGLERSVRQFVATDASSGGGLVREAAIGQLKYAVDLAQHASYSEAVGNRLLIAISDLASRVGWMSHDVGMDGPAQRYFWYALRAAHEAGTERAQLRSVGTLANLARQARATGHPDTARRILDLAIDRVPDDPRRFNAVRGELWSLRANAMGGFGVAHLSEVDRCINLSLDLYRKSADDEYSPAVADYFPYACEAELAGVAAASYHELAQEDTQLATRAEQHARYALDHRGDGFTRSKIFDQVTLARVRLRAGEIEQACLDGQQAVQMAAEVTESKRVRTHLRQLMNDTTPYQQQSAVRELREELRGAVAGQG
jgi:transcriptional regulator with XRE-family HTH domain